MESGRKIPWQPQVQAGQVVPAQTVEGIPKVFDPLGDSVVVDDHLAWSVDHPGHGGVLIDENVRPREKSPRD